MGRSLENIKYHHWQKKLSCNIAKAYLLFLTSLLISAVTLCHVLHNHGKKNTHRLIFLTFSAVRCSSNSTNDSPFFPLNDKMIIYLTSLFSPLFSLSPQSSVLPLFLFFCLFQWEKSLGSLVVFMFCCISFTEICSLTCSSIFNFNQLNIFWSWQYLWKKKLQTQWQVGILQVTKYCYICHSTGIM